MTAAESGSIIRTMPDVVLLPLTIFLAVITVILLALLLLGRRSGASDPSGMLETINRRLEQVERMSAQMGSLSEIFLVPQARGSFGELMLEDMLKTWLPPKAFSIQHKFASGVRADAVIRLDRYMVAVDAKFPLESLKREFREPSGDGPLPSDVRRAFLKHIGDIAEKYIAPGEGTLSFALMYVPSERVYYEAFVRRGTELMEEALKKGVVPVSPGNLFLYLQTVAFGLKGFAFPEERKRLMDTVFKLRQDLDAFRRLFVLTGNHMRNMQKAYDEAASRFAGLESLTRRIERPDEDDPDERPEESYLETKSGV